ncbi:BQ5605_C011g06421 [Microbotryum silenes-dioicae]|uniref:BQ5605_C011g06421 protein n=1 Tax=Microbotryum silenes-dioicae TaxID=796604 RepID=A0A2X0LSD9_9BASI|nr:BQ5605_C011g06421 [Microbotryum silenes-dioicae]
MSKMPQCSPLPLFPSLCAHFSTSVVQKLAKTYHPLHMFFFCMKLIANLQDEKTPYGTKGDAAQYA